MNREQTYLIDIATTCQTVIELVQGMNQSSFVADKRTHIAVLYEITVIGEIVKRLSPEFRQSHPEIPWKQMAGMRDQLVHDYNEVDLDLTWEVTQSSIPELLEFVLPLLPQEEVDNERRSPPYPPFQNFRGFTDEEQGRPHQLRHPIPHGTRSRKLNVKRQKVKV